MKKLLSLFIFTVLLAAIVLSQPVSPYSQKITGTNGTRPDSVTARICPPAGYVNLKAYSAWPFGTGGNLIIPAGNSFTIQGGKIYDYDSINIASTGTLVITADTGKWTVIGCRRGFVLDGTIDAHNGRNSSGTFILKEPDEYGNLTGAQIQYTITQGNGGNGGSGGNSHQVNNGGCFGSGGTFGVNYNGNGGGGGGGAGMCSNPGSCSLGFPGGNANDTVSGYGGACSWASPSLTTPGVGLYGQNGGFLAQCNSTNACNCCSASSYGGSGGTRGKHGALLYIKALKSITGSGSIDVSGQKGGDGGASDASGGASSSYYSGSGGGGGAGAGGSGGYVYIKYAGASPGITIIKNAGAGGQGGVAGSGISPGTNGFNGDAGVVGQSLLAPVNGYSFQWRKNFNVIGGAISDVYTATSQGLYDCIVTDPGNVTHATSPLDTVYTENQAIAQIISATYTICAGKSAALAAQYYKGQSYQWYKDPFPINGATSPAYNATLAGVYYVIANNSCNDEDTSQSITLVVNPNPAPPVISIIGNDTICPGASTQLQSSISSNIQWSTGATTPTITVTQGGNYSVTVTGGNSCTAFADTLITVLPASIKAGNDTSLSCGNGFTITPTYNPSGIVSVSWNPATYLNSASSQTPYCVPKDTVTYVVTANFTNGCTGKDTITVSAYSPALSICLVTVDSTSTRNEIVWEKPAQQGAIDSFIIYRDTANNNYAQIGIVPYNSLSTYADTARSIGGPNGGNPNATSWRYKIAVKDTCGNISAMSPYHQSIHLQNLGGGNFQWTQYLIQGQSPPVPALLNYVVLLDTFSAGNYTPIANPSASSTTFLDGSFSTYSATATYRVKTNWTINCAPSIINPKDPAVMVNINSTRSNTFRAQAPTWTGRNEFENSIRVFPNPSHSGNFTIEGMVPGDHLQIYSIYGEIIFETFNLNPERETLNLSEANGIYFLKVKTAGGVLNKKIVIAR